MTPDLHELANMPGAGRAQQKLKDAGYWKADDPEEMPRWWAVVRLTIEIDRVVDVAAPDEAAARKALKAFEEWDEDGEVTRVVVGGILPDHSPMGEPVVVAK